MQFVTDKYKIPSGVVIGIIMRRWLATWWWIVAVILAIFIALSLTINSAFIYVAAMLLFLVFPFAVVMAFFNYGFKPRVVAFCHLQRAQLEGNILTIEYFSDADDLEDCEILKREKIDLRRAKDIYVYRNYLVIVAGKAPDDFQIVPRPALVDGEIDIADRLEEAVYGAMRSDSHDFS